MGHISFNSANYPETIIDLHDDHTFFKILVRSWRGLWEVLKDDVWIWEDVRIPNAEELDRFLARKKLKIVGVRPIVFIPLHYNRFRRAFALPVRPTYVYCEPVK